MSFFDSILGGGGGGGILGGIGSIFGGNDAGNAGAAAAQSADPFGPYRERYIGRLNELFNDPSALTNSSRFKAGSRAVEGSQAARGMLNSGNTMTALQDYGQNSFDQYAQLLAGLSGAGAVGGGASYLQQGQLAQSGGMTSGIGSILGGLGGLFGGGGGGGGFMSGLGSLFGGGGGASEISSGWV